MVVKKALHLLYSRLQREVLESFERVHKDNGKKCMERSARQGVGVLRVLRIHTEETPGRIDGVHDRSKMKKRTISRVFADGRRARVHSCTDEIFYEFLRRRFIVRVANVQYSQAPWAVQYTYAIRKYAAISS